MGNCLRCVDDKEKKKRKEVVQLDRIDQPMVNQWVASSDFSSLPDRDPSVTGDDDDISSRRPVDVTIVVANSSLEDGYTTAAEHFDVESEVECPGATIFPTPTRTESPNASEGSVDGKSSCYETSDEVERSPAMCTPKQHVHELTTPKMDCEQPSMGNDATLSTDDETEVTEIGEDRAIHPMPTPLRNHQLTPSSFEALADRKGRVRTKKVSRFLQLREEPPS